MPNQKDVDVADAVLAGLKKATDLYVVERERRTQAEERLGRLVAASRALIAMFDAPGSPDGGELDRAVEQDFRRAVADAGSTSQR